jgi:peptide/nickel transport system ATP-binding protein/oligopeptide transport system ATP-binding protein
MEPLLSIRNLAVSFRTEAGLARAVDGVSFDVYPGETLGVVGESGCGKTVTALSVLRLIQAPGNIDAGEISYRGRDLLKLSDREMRRVRGNEISMIFQEPMTSLNPVFTCGYQVREAILLHQNVNKAQARELTIEMLDVVGIPDPRVIDRSYPHQLSGGMRQRVMIAMALSCNPSLLIADEPTTALDVTIQAQILDLLQSLQERFKMAIMMITHDLGVIAETAKRVVVMYAGQVAETASVVDIFGHARHPYTLGLQASIPRITHKGKKLSVIPGRVPDPLDYGRGCRFADRCPYVEDRCTAESVVLRVAAGRHEVRCWKEIESSRVIDHG